MIKKILGLFIVGLGILNFGFCVNITSDLPYFNYNGVNKVNIDTYINLDDGDGNPIILFQSTYNTSNRVNYFYWWEDGKLYGYKADNNSYYKGALNYVRFCDNNFENCGSSVSPENFYNGSLIGTVFNKILIKDQNEVAICFGNDNGSVCTLDNASFCYSFNSCGSPGLGGAGATIESIINNKGDNIQKYSPFNVEGGEEEGGDEGDLTEILLNYNNSVNWFEKRYGRSSDICYVGIDDCTTIYGSPVSFQAGSGLDIFELYSCLYNTGVDINRVYVWLNSWLGNFEQWNSGSPWYFATYNSGTNQVDLTFDNLTVSPFVNKPVALYFMADHIERYSEYSTMGSEVASYCNLVLNPNNIEDEQVLVDQIIDNSSKISIVDQTAQNNINQGLNPDGSQNVIDYSQFGYNTGSNWYGSGNGSTGDVVGGSGVQLAFSGNTTIKNTLTNFFDETKSIFDVLSFNTNYRILPSYLATAFIFVVLFRFLRKK